MLVSALITLSLASIALAAEPEGTLVFASSGEAIRVFRLLTKNLDVSQNVTLMPLGVAAETPNATFFEIDLPRRLLFAVQETEAGAVSAFSIGDDGKLTLINRKPSLGERPCHLTMDRQGRHLLVVNCGTGSLSLVPVGADGTLGEGSLIQKSGARSAAFDPANRFAFVCETDRVNVYRFEDGKLTPADPVPVKAGTHPRRIAFRPDGKFAYVLNEKASTVTAYAYDAGKLTEGASESTLPGYYDGPNAAVEIGMHPKGKYLYVSNQGHNSVVLFSLDAATGAPAFVEEQGTGGRNPIHFGIQPSAVHLTIANRDTNQLLVARIDADNGRLKPSGVFVPMAAPTCVRFLPPK
jgi:6-phosphogluconolactonase